MLDIIHEVGDILPLEIYNLLINCEQEWANWLYNFPFRCNWLSQTAKEHLLKMMIVQRDLQQAEIQKMPGQKAYWIAMAIT